MQPWVVVDKKLAPDGVALELVRHGDAWIVRAGGQMLMSSRTFGSEVELATLGCEALGAAPRRVLVGGLGLGYTLRAVLDRLAPTGVIVVSELVAALVEWNQGPLAPLAGNPLQDARVSVQLGDVKDAIAQGGVAEQRFDVILLDVDNGPAVVAHAANAALYGERGSRAALAALRPGGVFAVWSAGSDPAYVRTLTAAGFEGAHEKAVRAHRGAGARHVVFVARRPA